MIRKAFRMSVHPGREAEYAERHAPIWSELYFFGKMIGSTSVVV